MTNKTPNNMAGAGFMIIAMAAFAVEDMFLKAAMRDMSVGLALSIFGALGSVIFGLMCRLQGQPLLHPLMFRKVMMLRSGFEILGRLCFAVAIGLTPLSSASAILQATPLVVTLGAVLVFGERVGPRRWLAIFVGFLGVMVILRPGLSTFDPLSIFAVLATIGFAGRDLATRASPVSMSSAQLGFAGFFVVILAGVVLLGVSGDLAPPAPNSFGLVCVASLVGVFAYNALTRAMRTGDVSVVTPFRYVRLVFAMLIGVMIFGERPDVWTVVGSGIIVLTGLYILARARSESAVKSA